MKIKDIIANINKQTDDLPSWESITSFFDIYNLPWSDDTRLVCYAIKSWNCTDSWVGWFAYFLDDEFVFTTKQSGRKSSETFKFVSKEAVSKVRNYLQDLASENITFDIIDLEENIEDTYPIEFCEQLIPKYHKVALYGDKEATIIKVTRGYSTSNDVLVRFEDNVEKIINIRELRFRYNQNFTHQSFGNLSKLDYRDIKLESLFK